MKQNRIDVSDKTAISMPMRNLLGIISAVAVGVYAFFGIQETLNIWHIHHQEKDKSYHGKLIGSGSISGSYRKDNQFPLMDNCESFKFNDSNDLENKIKNLKSKGQVYAVIIEPYSASLLESCSDIFMEKLNELKKKYEFRIIFDEVFSGWYKSEKLFYFQNFKSQIVTDVITLSKAMGGGKSSISCIVVNDDVYKIAYGQLSDTFLHTTTYNGFAEECITAIEATNLLASEEFKKKAQS